MCKSLRAHGDSEEDTMFNVPFPTSLSFVSDNLDSCLLASVVVFSMTDACCVLVTCSATLPY
jgi:hypothetical protein